MICIGKLNERNHAHKNKLKSLITPIYFLSLLSFNSKNLTLKSMQINHNFYSMIIRNKN